MLDIGLFTSIAHSAVGPPGEHGPIAAVKKLCTAFLFSLGWFAGSSVCSCERLGNECGLDCPSSLVCVMVADVANQID